MTGFVCRANIQPRDTQIKTRICDLLIPGFFRKSWIFPDQRHSFFVCGLRGSGVRHARRKNARFAGRPPAAAVSAPSLSCRAHCRRHAWPGLRQCHPERSEGSDIQMFRFAQHDKGDVHDRGDCRLFLRLRPAFREESFDQSRPLQSLRNCFEIINFNLYGLLCRFFRYFSVT